MSSVLWPYEIPVPAPSVWWALGSFSPHVPGGWPLDQTTMFWALQPGRPVADSRPFCTLLVKLLDSDQELYRNFPLTISERWQQEVAETVFDTINAETDRLEARKKTKNKQLGHEEGEGQQLPWAPTARSRDGKQAQVSAGVPPREQLTRHSHRLGGRLSSLSLSLRQTTPWARTASCMATCPRWATPS